MSFWFFKRDKIQNSLPLALVTHNPDHIDFESLYHLFVCYKYNLPLLSLPNRLAGLFIFPPSLIWKSAAKFGRQDTRPVCDTYY